MDVIKIQKNFWNIVGVSILFSCYWIGFTVMYLTDSFDLLRTVIAIIFNALTLYWLCGVLIECAEPYELERVTRYAYVLWGLRPSALEAVIVFLGYSIANIGSVFAKESVGSDLTTAVVILMFGTLFIILGCKWWMDTLKWRIDIEKYRVPRSEWL